MIPLPRPSLPIGACQECGKPHHGLCHFADVEAMQSDLNRHLAAAKEELLRLERHRLMELFYGPGWDQKPSD